MSIVSPMMARNPLEQDLQLRDASVVIDTTGRIEIHVRTELDFDALAELYDGEQHTVTTDRYQFRVLTVRVGGPVRGVDVVKFYGPNVPRQDV